MKVALMAACSNPPSFKGEGGASDDLHRVYNASSVHWYVGAGDCANLQGQREFAAGWGSGASELQASVEALLRGEAALLPDGMAAALPPALPPLAFTAAATEPEGNILRLPASELRAWLPAWAASKGDCASQGAGNAFSLHRSCADTHFSQSCHRVFHEVLVLFMAQNTALATLKVRALAHNPRC